MCAARPRATQVTQRGGGHPPRRALVRICLTAPTNTRRGRRVRGKQAADIHNSSGTWRRLSCGAAQKIDGTKKQSRHQRKNNGNTQQASTDKTAAQHQVTAHLNRAAKSTPRLSVLRLRIGNILLSGVVVGLSPPVPSAAQPMTGAALGHNQETA